MKKRILEVLATVLFLLTITGLANAALTTIGTATYDGMDCNLIYDADSPFGPITWLDYSNSWQEWSDQVSWAADLGALLTVTLNSGYTTSVDWTTGWRLPNTVDGPWVYGYDGTTTAGYNITTSEMGHLFYTALGNQGRYDTSAGYVGGSLDNTGDFENLIAQSYWSDTEYALESSHAWGFHMNYTYQDKGLKFNSQLGLAVRSGQVSAVPVPAAVWLLGSGLTCLVVLGRRRNRNSV